MVAENVKSPTGNVHALEHSIRGLHSTLCQYKNPKNENTNQYYHEWPLTSDGITCSKCLAILRKEFGKEAEEEILLNNFDVAFLEQCDLKKQSNFNEIKFKLQWGTFGEPRGKILKWVRLVDCSSELLHTILAKHLTLPKITLNVIGAILKDREYTEGN